MNELYEKIEDYLGGTLSPGERAAFEAALDADPELRAETARQHELLRRLDAARRRHWVGTNIEIKRRAGKWLWVVAAILVIGGSVIGFFFLSEKKAIPQMEEPVQGPIPQTPVALDTLTEPIPSPAQKLPGTSRPPSRALLAYQEALDAQEPIQYTAMGHELVDQEAERLINGAIDLMREGKQAEAAAFLQPFLDDADSFYRDDAEWLHALSWMPRDEDKARSMLAEIAQDYAHPYRLRALVVLEKMK